MISNRSRYAESKTTLIDTTRGTNVTIVPGQQRPFAFNFTFYRWVDGDRLDLLAQDLFSDGGQWWRIADANPEILDWSDVAVGRVLRLPSV